MCRPRSSGDQLASAAPSSRMAPRFSGHTPVSARARGTVCFIARWEGHPIAAAAIAMHDGVALLAGASTDPSFRGRGAQAALLDTRLAYATSMGCELAMMGALPGSASQRNGERQGFRIAYTRIKWQLHHVSSRA